MENIIDSLPPISSFDEIVIWGSVFCYVVLLFIYLKTKSRSLLNAMPGISTSLGILFTFICISNGLGQDIESIDSINKLVLAIKPAFSTSIYGILASMIETLLNRFFFSIMDKKEMAGVTKIPERCLEDIENNTSSLIGAIQNLNETIRNEQSTMRQSLEEFNVKLQKVQESGLQDLVNKMSTTINNLSSRYELFLSNQKDIQSSQSKSFTDAMTQLGENMKSYSDEMKDKMAQFFHGFNNSLDGLVQSVTEEQMDRLSQVLESLSNSLKTQSTQLLADQVESMRSITHQIENVAETVKEAMHNSSNTLQEEANNNAMRFTEQLNEQRERQNQFNENQSQLVAAGFSSLSSEIGSMFHNMTNAIQTSVERMESITQQIEGVGETVKEAMHNSSNTLQEEAEENARRFAEQLNEQRERQNQFNERQSEKMADEFAVLSSNLSSLVNDMTTSIQASVERLSGSIQRTEEMLNNSYAQTSGHLEKIRDKFEGVMATTTQAFAQASNEYTNAVRLINDAGNSYGETIQEISASNDALKSVGQDIASIVSTVKTSSDTMKGMLEQIDKLSQAIASLHNLEIQISKISQQNAKVA